MLTRREKTPEKIAALRNGAPLLRLRPSLPLGEGGEPGEGLAAEPVLTPALSPREKKAGAPRKAAPTRRGTSLLLCLVVMMLTTMILTGIYNSTTAQMSALGNTNDFERALYLAGAGAHQALAELEVNSGWTTGIPATQFPAGSGYTYSATVAAGAGGTTIVTGIGTAGSVTRKVQVTVQQGA